MAFNRPSLQQLVDRGASDIEAGLPGTDARLRRSNLNVLARVLAGGFHGLYGYLDFIARQVSVETADAEFLDRKASTFKVFRKPADYARGQVLLTGTAGAEVLNGARMLRGDGALYYTTADVVVGGGGTVLAEVIADAPGAAGNSDAGATLSFDQPVASVQATGTVQAPGLTGGIDEEDDDSLRARLVARIQAPPNGGSAADYVRWALEVPGVTRAWVYPLESGVGTVTVRFVRDDDVSFIPDAGEVAAVQAYIDELRPVCANVTVAAPTAVPLALTIALTPDTPTVRAAVTAELTDLLLREASPGGTILLSHLREAISVASGETNHVLSVPSADVTHTSSQIAVLGTITWV